MRIAAWRSELRWSRTMPNCTGDRHVGQLHAGGGLSQQQAAPAHVATTHEVDRKDELSAEDLQQSIDIFGRCDAAEQHDFTVANFAAERRCALLERPPVGAIVRIDILGGELSDRRAGHPCIGAAQAGVGRDDMDTAADDRIVDVRRGCEMTRVGQFAAEVERADERKQVAERNTFARAQTLSGVRLRIRREQLRTAATITVRR